MSRIPRPSLVRQASAHLPERSVVRLLSIAGAAALFWKQQPQATDMAEAGAALGSQLTPEFTAEFLSKIMDHSGAPGKSLQQIDEAGLVGEALKVIIRRERDERYPNESVPYGHLSLLVVEAPRLWTELREKFREEMEATSADALLNLVSGQIERTGPQALPRSQEQRGLDEEFVWIGHYLAAGGKLTDGEVSPDDLRLAPAQAESLGWRIATELPTTVFSLLCDETAGKAYRASVLRYFDRLDRRLDRIEGKQDRQLEQGETILAEVRKIAPPGPRRPALKTNIESLLDQPFVGRKTSLDEIDALLADREREGAVLLHGPSGAGKSELARRYGEAHLDDYPGGVYFIDFGADPSVSLATIGAECRGFRFPSDMPIQDQAKTVFHSFCGPGALLIYDNPSSTEALEGWLPLAKSKMHVVVTSVNSELLPFGRRVRVEPLDDPVCRELVRQIAGIDPDSPAGRHLLQMAGGLPMQIVPACRWLRREAGRGRLESATAALMQEMRSSFTAPYESLPESARLLLHAAAFLSDGQIPEQELASAVCEGLRTSHAQFSEELDRCVDLSLLEGEKTLRMHRLLATFLDETRAGPGSGFPPEKLDAIRQAQRGRFLVLAGELGENPADRDRAALFLAYPVAQPPWKRDGMSFSSEESHAVGYALSEIGRFAEAQPWYEQAAEEIEKGDIFGRVPTQDLEVVRKYLEECRRLCGEP